MKTDKPGEVYREMVEDLANAKEEVMIDDLPQEQQDWLRAR